MKQYLLVSSGGPVVEDGAERNAEMAALRQWYGELGDALIDGGAALTGDEKTIAADGEVLDDSAPLVANGYMVVKAGSLDDAVALAHGFPLLQRGFQISVLETAKDVD